MLFGKLKEVLLHFNFSLKITSDPGGWVGEDVSLEGIQEYLILRK